MKRKRSCSCLLKIIFSLLTLNVITFYFFFSSSFGHRTPPPVNHHVNSDHRELTSQTLKRYLKPWPILPQYLPWSLNPNVSFRSCEGYFGNGFNRIADLIRPEPEIGRKSRIYGNGGWFRCLYSDTLRSSVCEGGRIRMDPERIKMSSGGERLEVVIGRKEEEELPQFESGAFSLDGGTGGGRRLASEEFLDRYVPEGEVMMHTMRGLIGSMEVVAGTDFTCSEWVDEPALLVTRFEYANLFHTMTDLYSAYVASRVTGLPNRPHLIFVDGHCLAPLEEIWKKLFSSVRYAKNFSGPVCFRHAILSPLGYETALFKGLSENIDCHGASAQYLWQNPDDRKTARLSEFGEMMRAAFGFPVQRLRIRKKYSVHNVLFVRRENYLAHPRHGGKVESRLSNEQEVFDSIKVWASNHGECKINMVNGLFAHMAMNEQIKAIQDASVIIGAHGAGLTHIISATEKTVILEIISSAYRRPHFALIAHWKGLEYHAINLDGSYADTSVVIDTLSNIMKSFDCGS